MCGIYASISTTGFKSPSSGLKTLLRNRGPDHFGQAHAEIKKGGETLSLSFTSTVLALRGGHIEAQPFVDSQSGSILCWNGEAWRIDSKSVAGNDGQKVFENLLRATSGPLCSNSNGAVLSVLRSISGPFAFVFLDKIHSRIYFSRDRLGRRSLLCNTDSLPSFMEFASISEPGSHCWKEVEADSIYQLSFSMESGSQSYIDHLSTTTLSPLQSYPWVPNDRPSSLSPLGLFNRSIPFGVDALTIISESVTLLKAQLFESLKLRVLNVPVPPALAQTQNVRIAVLFSGGLDCTVLARMVHNILPLDQHIDLINVAFENPRVVAGSKETPKSKTLIQNRPAPGAQILVQNDTEHKKSDKLTPYEMCPDRITGRKSFQELQNICVDRVWRFVAIDIPYSETLAHRDDVIKLMYPHNTEMDLSIAYALYFAARGSGIASSNLDIRSTSYTTPARVLLSGLGADELFAGYTRHATCFNRNGFAGLLDELELDINRLGKRNLGRDDRVISHWGREARFPYLEESLVKWAVECPIWEKCGFQTTALKEPETPVLEPGKKVLRLLAYDLGMYSVAQEKKRAIQFGARTAKMEFGRTKGTTLIS